MWPRLDQSDCKILSIGDITQNSLYNLYSQIFLFLQEFNKAQEQKYNII